VRDISVIKADLDDAERPAAEDEVRRGSSLGHGLISGKSFASFRTSIKLQLTG
jgi:hypothetical protein